MKHLHTCVLLVFFLSAINANSQSGPVSQKQLLAWTIGGMSEGHVLALLQQRGINSCNDELSAALHSAGAANQVIHQVRTKAAKNAATDTSPAFGFLLKAAKSVGEENYELAYAHLTDALASEPNNPDLHFARAGVLQKAESWDEAVREYRRTVQLAFDFADAHQGLAYVYYRMGDGIRAAAAAREAIRIASNDSDAHKYLGLALDAQKDFNGSIAEYKEALRLDPANAAVYFDLGIVTAEKGDVDGAIAAYKNAIKLNPNEWKYYYNLGVAFGKKEDYERAIEPYRKAKELKPDALEVRQNLGAAYCETKRHADAVSELRELLKMDPSWNMARPCLYNSLSAQGDFEGASQVAQESLRYEPDDPGMLQAVGDWYLVHKRYSDAETYSQRLIEAEEQLSGVSSPQVALAAVRKAEALTMEKKFQEADGQYKRAIAILRRADPKSRKQDLDDVNRGYRMFLDEWHASQANRIQTSEHSTSSATPAALAGLPPDLAVSASSPEELWHEQMQSAERAVNQQRFADADKLFEKALKQAQAIVPDRGQVSLTLRQWSASYMRQRNFERAEELQNRLIAIAANQFGPESPTTTEARDGLANLYMIESKYHDAELLYVQNLKTLEKTLNPRDPQYGIALERLASAYMSQKMFEKAEPLLLQYLKSAEEFYGAGSFDVSVPVDHLASLYLQLHKYDQAEIFYRRALALGEKHFGPNSQMLNGNLYSLAQALRYQGRADEAKQLDVRREALGKK